MKRLYAAIAFLLIILATSAFTIFQCRQFRDQAIPHLHPADHVPLHRDALQLEEAGQVRL